MSRVLPNFDVTYIYICPFYTQEMKVCVNFVLFFLETNIKIHNIFKNEKLS